MREVLVCLLIFGLLLPAPLLSQEAEEEGSASSESVEPATLAAQAAGAQAGAGEPGEAQTQPPAQAGPTAGEKTPKPEPRPQGAFALGVLAKELDTERKKALYGFAAERLSKAYRLVPVGSYLRAEGEVKSTGVACPGEACNDELQKLLKVGRLFSLDIGHGEKSAQLTLTLARGKESFQFRETCTDCELWQLKAAILELVGAAVAEDLGAPPALKELAEKAAEKTPPAPPAEAPRAEQGFSLSNLPMWAYIAGGVVLLALLAGGGGGDVPPPEPITGDIGLTW